MFKDNNIKLFMGGEFSIPETPQNAKQLRDLFQSWANEVDHWGDEPEKLGLTEVEIVKGQIVVTLEDGIAG